MSTRRLRIRPYVPTPVDPELIRRWLEPQPAPVGDGLSVTDWLLQVAPLIVPELRDPANPRPWNLFEALVLGRREQGLERYGTELRAFNGRNPTIDQLQEVVDETLYATQALMEHAGDGGDVNRRYRLGLAIRMLLDLAHELEVAR
jgi:hypothetical protein